MSASPAPASWTHTVTVWHDAFRFGVDAAGLLLLLITGLAEMQRSAAAADEGALPLRLLAGMAAVLAAVIAERYRIRAGNGVSFSFGSAVLFASFFMLGPWWAGVGLLAGNLVRMRPWRTRVFYGLQWVVATGLAGLIYEALGGQYGLVDSWSAPGAVAAAIATIFVVNSALVYWSFYHINRMSWRDIRSYFAGDARIYGASAFMALSLTYCAYLVATEGERSLPVLVIIGLMGGVLLGLVRDNLNLRARAAQFTALTDLAGKLIWTPVTPDPEGDERLALTIPEQVTPELDEQLTAILESLRVLLDFARATIWVAPGQDGPLRRLTSYRVPAADRWGLIALEPLLPPPQGATHIWPGVYAATVNRACDTGAPTTAYVETDPVTGIAGVLAVPLVVMDRTVGVLALESVKAYFLQSAGERQTLVIAHHLALFLVRSSLAAEQHRLATGLAALQARTRAENERLASEMRAASRIQERLLPQAAPELPGLALAGVSVPAMEVGGDFYDWQALPGGRLALLLGDATGKGTAAVMQIAMVKTLLADLWGHAGQPGLVLQQLNTSLYNILPQNGMTMFCAVVDPAAGTITYANAGHVYPYLARQSDIRDLPGGGLPLGMLPVISYQERTVPFAPGMMLVLYSDGVVEAQNRTGTLFGFERLESLLQAPAGTPEQMLRRILDAVSVYTRGGAPTDDVSVLVVARAE
ncbi:MAG TPA: SpoIIE family protein phosphatase [Chloroflexia bacterium]|nr:SpoIIE family protein phosphatase [Chloroflexia bacterium]